jgi:hypothetical protein
MATNPAKQTGKTPATAEPGSGELHSVKLKTGRSNGRVTDNPGDVIDVDIREAWRLNESGQAVFCDTKGDRLPREKIPPRPAKIWPEGSPEGVLAGECKPPEKKKPAAGASPRPGDAAAGGDDDDSLDD